MPVKRAMCARCLRAQSACICQWIAPVASSVELLILQHPLEVANAKNSARLLHLCVPGSVLVVGETLDLTGLLEAGGRTPVLLYPETPGPVVLAAPAPAVLAAPERLRLVIVDATWRKSRKMLYLNPVLQALPRIALRAMPASHYRIRKAHAPDQLATLEAAAYALLQLGGSAAQCDRLIAAFDGLVGQVASRAPPPGNQPGRQ